MKIDRRFDRTVNTQRQEDVAGSKRQVWADKLTNLRCAIQPQSGEQQILQEAIYKGFEMWTFEKTDIITGDKVIEGSKVYIVKGVREMDFGRNKHISIDMLLTNSTN